MYLPMFRGALNPARALLAGWPSHWRNFAMVYLDRPILALWGRSAYQMKRLLEADPTE